MRADKTKLCGKERRAARDLLQLVKAGDHDAFNRAGVVLHHFDPDTFGLMKAQHVIAVEKGCRSWADLLAKEGS